MSSLSRFFRDGVGTHKKPLPARQSLEVLPGVFSWDPAYMEFQREMSTLLDKELPAEVDDERFSTAAGVHVGFERLRSVSGYSMNPISYVAVQNEAYCRDELGLPTNWRSERHRKIAENVWRIVFSTYKPSPINLPKHSTSGFTEFTFDAEWKRNKALDMLLNWQDIAKLSRNSELTQLADLYGVLFCFNLNKRDQVEPPGKKRVVFTLDYALGLSDATSVADKSVFIHGKQWPDFTAMRSRVVQGGPWPVNFFIQVMATGHLYALFERFPKTFHHVDAHELCERFSEKGDVALFDVSDYDRSLQDFMYDTKFHVMREFWDDWLVQWAERFHYAPYYARPLDIEGKTGQFVGNPLIDAKQVHCGNRSGDGMTSLDAKVFKVIDTLTLIDDLTHDVLGNEEMYLEWKMPHAIANNGDDEGITGAHSSVRELVRMRLATDADGKIVHGYLKCDLEVGQVFSGDLIHKTSDGKFVPIRRIHTMLEKTFCPERPIGGVFRKYWFLGVTDRVTLNEGLPSYNAAMDVVNSCWRKHLQRDHGTFWGLVEQALAESEFALGSLTNAEKAVLYDPSKLFYQFSPDDIGPDILNAVVEKIKFDEVEEFVTANYNGHLL